MLLDLKELHKKYNLDIKGIIHIGAHQGEEYETYRQLGVDNLLFFEPILESYEITRKNVKGIVVNKALGNFNGKANLYIASNGASSSLLEPDLHRIQYPNITFDKTIRVNVVRLDDFLETILPCTEYNFINIDVQGYELEVFKGSIKTLKNIDYIMTEVNRAELYKDCVQLTELDEFLKEYNFNRVETYWAGKTWGDAFYVKEK